SNRTCGFPASGFPTGFVVGSRTRSHWPLQADHAQRTIHPFLRELADAVRRHLVAPSQKMPHLVIHMLINRPVCLARRPASEVISPASQHLVQPLTPLFPRRYVTRLQ